MKSYRMSLNTYEEKMEAISLFESLGYVVNRSNVKIWCNLQVIENGFGAFFAEERRKGDLITMQQLKDLVVLHRNDVSDATHTGQLVGKYYVTEDGETYNFNGLKWVPTGVPNRILNPIDVEKSEEQMVLISGADALRALADGEDVQVMLLKIGKWVSLREFPEYKVTDLILNPHGDKFRIKPHTVKLEIEIPAPFIPKFGEEYWFLVIGATTPYGQEHWKNSSFDKRALSFGVWRTEDEIKIVVEQLRKLKVIS